MMLRLQNMAFVVFCLCPHITWTVAVRCPDSLFFLDHITSMYCAGGLDLIWILDRFVPRDQHVCSQVYPASVNK
jgi:hypothetical protein